MAQGALPLAIVGAGLIADLAVDIVSESLEFSVECFVVDEPFYSAACQIRGSERVRTWDAFVRSEPVPVFVAMGYHRLNSLRMDKIGQLRELGFPLVNLVSRAAQAAPSAALGANVLLDRGAILQSRCEVGDGVFVFGGAVVGHHTQLDRAAWVSSGSTIGGDCRIGERAFLGLGSRLQHGTRLGPAAYVGMGVSVSGSHGHGTAFASAPSRVLPAGSDVIARTLGY